MKLKPLTIVLMTAIFLSGMLAPIHPAVSQTTPDWYLGFTTGRVVAFGVENGAAQIGMEWGLEPGQSLLDAWRLGPQAFLLILQVENSEDYRIWLMTAESRRELTDLIGWNSLPNGWPFPVVYAHNSLVLFDPASLEPTLLVVDLDQAEVKRFAPVDSAGGPRLSADGTTLRFVTRSNNLPDEWRLNELDLASGRLQVSNVIQVASSNLPAIRSDQTGEFWLVRPPLVSTALLVNVNGQVETVTSPLVGADIQTGLLDDHVYQVDMACPADCVLYARHVSAATWNAYPLPDALPMTSVHLRNFVNGELLFRADPAAIGLIPPNTAAEMIGYAVETIDLSPDHAYIVLADADTDPTQHFVYSFARHERLFAWEASGYTRVVFGPASVGVWQPTNLLYRFTEGQLIEVPTPPNEQLKIGSRALLADGSLLIGGREGEGEATVRYIFHFDPLQDEMPREILQGVELFPIREVSMWWVAGCGVNPGC
ncbi:MAG: hypothetical protein K8L91_16595 [Anaerolineae bacterium]|nr:hypothetical protein [Anaerolineae bacterium]